MGGLASGLDTASIIDGLTKLEQRPLDTLRAQQDDFRTQISLSVSWSARSRPCRSAAQTLADSGTVGMKTTSTNTDFSAVGSAKSQAGTYTVSVQDLATSAQARSRASRSDAPHARSTAAR